MFDASVQSYKIVGGEPEVDRLGREAPVAETHNGFAIRTENSVNLLKHF